MAKLSALDRVGIAVATAVCITGSIVLSDPSEPEIRRIMVDAPSWTITASHRLCFEAIPLNAADLLSECLTGADRKQAVRS